MAAGDSLRFCDSAESGFVDSKFIESNLKDSKDYIESKIQNDKKDSKSYTESKLQDFIESKNIESSLKDSKLAFAYNKKPNVKKQWIRINTTPLWLIVLQNLSKQILTSLAKLDSIKLTQIIITASTTDLHYMKKLCPSSLDSIIQANTNIPIHIIQGGNTRYNSLKNVLQFIESNLQDSIDSHFIMVNDCARFNTQLKVIHDLLESLSCENNDCIAPFINISDTAIYIDSENITHLKRENLKLIQTPQISKLSKLIESTTLNIDFSDETSAINALNFATHTQDSKMDSKIDSKATIKLIDGDKQMNKLTTTQDLHLLKPLFENIESSNILIGQGSDIHAFTSADENKPMYLCGVRIESNIGFKAHSDGDVGIHAIIDAILGAMNCGDIGELFPDSDNAYKNADSKILLKKVYDYTLSVGLEIVNLDVTLIAQTPKISPYKSQMQEALAHILYLQKSQISIKATTAEHLGFIGRKEGILATAITQLKPRNIFKEMQ